METLELSYLACEAAHEAEPECQEAAGSESVVIGLRIGSQMPM